MLAALGGSQLDRPGEKTFVAWFGVRGVGSLYYMAIAVEAGVLAAGEQELVVWTVIVAVLHLDRRPRHHGRALACAGCSGRGELLDGGRVRVAR